MGEANRRKTIMEPHCHPSNIYHLPPAMRQYSKAAMAHAEQQMGELLVKRPDLMLSGLADQSMMKEQYGDDAELRLHYERARMTSPEMVHCRTSMAAYQRCEGRGKQEYNQRVSSRARPHDSAK